MYSPIPQFATNRPECAMKMLSKIVWSEGMYLGPHHFQAQSRYFEDSIQFATANLWDDAHGVAACQLDPDALRNGTVSVIHARGLFQDGLVFDMPECDPLTGTAQHHRSLLANRRSHHHEPRN